LWSRGVKREAISNNLQDFPKGTLTELTLNKQRWGSTKGIPMEEMTDSSSLCDK